MTDTGPALAANEATAAPQGTAAANERALAAVPLATPTVPVPRGPVNRPTDRPLEPVQAGLPVGPGGSGIPLPDRNDKTMAQLDGLLRVSQDPALAVMVGRLKAARLRQ